MKNSERAEAVERVVEAIRALPDDAIITHIDWAHYKGNGVIECSHADLKALVESHERRGEALVEAVETIHNLHGDVAWEIYRDNSPEMKRIIAASPHPRR